MRWLVGVSVVTYLAVCAAAISARQAPEAGEFRPPPAPVQPIAYSHKSHIAAGLTCAECHTTAETSERATIPPTAECMTCHAKERRDSPEIVKLAGFDSRKEEVPWRRVYRVPEYVYFSHAEHLSNKSITCDTCHGDVASLDVMQKLKDTSMAACIQCHKQHSAPILCDSCHEKM